MSNFDSFVQEQLARPGVARAYNRLAPFYRLADQLLLLRKKRSLTQQELAGKAHTTQAVVSRLENASVRCSLETVVRLAEALDATIEVRLIPLENLEAAEEVGVPAEEHYAETKTLAELARQIDHMRQEAGLSIDELLVSLHEQRERYHTEQYNAGDESA